MSQEYQRNPAVRVLASELNKADYHFKEKDEDRAPKYLLLPSGEKANRVMTGGTVLSVEDTSSDGDSSFWKVRIDDGTGEYFAFAGQYEKEAASIFQSIADNPNQPPVFVHIVGKTSEYRPEDDESEVIINIRPENVSVVSDNQRENWLRETCNQTISRLERQEGEYVRQAEDRYGNRVDLLRNDLQEILATLD